MPSEPAPRSAASLFGLPEDASASELAAARQQLDAFLAQAPAGLQGWAEQQRRLADSVGATIEAPGSRPLGDHELAALGLDPEVAGASAATPEPVRFSGPKKRNPWLVPGVLAVLSALVVGVYLAGGKQAQPADPQAAAASQMQQAQAGSSAKPADPKMVAALEAKVKANPKDVTSMKALGQVYDMAGEYDKAAAWQQRVTEVTPGDVDAWLALGVAQFNGTNLKDAEVSWKKAAVLAPKRAEIYYNLGFLYMSQNKMAQAREAWQTVVDLDPNSDLAKSLQAHLKKYDASASPTPSATTQAAATHPSASPTR